MEAKRKPLSKKMRFNVFKRDGFVCCYCGRRPPETILEVDHITPVCKGGKNRMVNLITSCFDCNRGKGVTSVSKKDNIESYLLIKEKRDQLKAYNRVIESIEAEIETQIDMIDQVFFNFTRKRLTSYSRRSVKLFISKLGVQKVKEAVEMSFGQSPNRTAFHAFKYMCGICWNWIKMGSDNES